MEFNGQRFSGRITEAKTREIVPLSIRRVEHAVYHRRYGCENSRSITGYYLKHLFGGGPLSKKSGRPANGKREKKVGPGSVPEEEFRH